MKKSKIIIPTIITLFSILCPVASYAQIEKKAYTLPQIIDEALKNNNNIKTANLEIDYSKANKKSANDIGKTNVSLTYGQYNSVNTDNNISISQSIPFPTVFTSQVKLGNAITKGTELRLQVAKNNLIQEIKFCYYHLQYLLDERILLLSQDSIYTSFVKAARLKLKTGESNLLEKTTAETQLMELQNTIAQNQLDIQLSNWQIQVLMNSKLPVVISNTTEKKAMLNFLNDSMATNQNPSLSFLKQEVSISNLSKKVATAKILPDFTVGYFSQTLIGFQNVNGNENFFNGKKRFTGLQIGVAVPLWFGPQIAKIKAASLSEKIIEKKYEQGEIEIQLAYKQALQECKKNQSAISYYEQGALPNADLIIKQANNSFKNGAINYMEYLQAIKNSINIKSNYLQSVYQYNTSIVKLEYLIGK